MIIIQSHRTPPITLTYYHDECFRREYGGFTIDVLRAPEGVLSTTHYNYMTCFTYEVPNRARCENCGELINPNALTPTHPIRRIA